MKMTPIEIELESGASIAVILVDEMDSTLTEIRKQIQEEVNELVPEQYHFISAWGPPISRIQEAKMTLKEALQDEKKMIIRANEEEKQSLKRKAADLDERDDASEDGTTPPKARPRGKRPVQSTLTKTFGAKPSPTARYASVAVRKGVHIFTELDIKRSSGTEKERKTWWNEKAKELCEDPEYDMLRGEELDQKLHEEWRLYRAGKMLEEQKETIEAIQDFLEKYPDMEEYMTSQNKAKQETIERNVKRLEMSMNTVERSSDTLKQLSLQMQNVEKKGREFQSLKKEMREHQEAHQCHCRELTKAQDALSKVLAIKKLQLKELLERKDTKSAEVL